MLKLTQAQLDALYQAYLAWQNKTPHAIMPEEFEVVAEKDYKTEDYVGVWVAEPDKRSGKGFILLIIESDGYTHS